MWRATIITPLQWYFLPAESPLTDPLRFFHHYRKLLMILTSPAPPQLTLPSLASLIMYKTDLDPQNKEWCLFLCRPILISAQFPLWARAGLWCGALWRLLTEQSGALTKAYREEEESRKKIREVFSFLFGIWVPSINTTDLLSHYNFCW